MIAEQTSTRTTRRRAVRLTERGLPILEEALLAAWATRGIERKPTWEDRAELLDVSVVTARKILGCEGVDRSTLTLAFKKLGVDWKESYCEFVVQTTLRSAVVVAKSTEEKQPSFFRIYLLEGLLLFVLLLPWVAIRLLSFSDLEYGEIMVHEGYALYLNGEYKAAREHAAIAQAIAADWATFNLMREADVLEARCDVVSGDYVSAYAAYARVMEYHRRLHEPENFPAAHMDLAEVEIRQGRLAAAQNHLDQSLVGFMKQSNKTGMALVMSDIGTILTLQHKLDDADAWFALALQAAATENKIEIIADIHGRQALVLRDRHRFAEARKLLDGTLTYWESQKHQRWIARSLIDRGTVEATAGSNGLAIQLLARARTFYAKVGDNPGVQECDLWLSKCVQPSR